VLAYLVARPHGVRGRCILGRETALAAVRWGDDGWPTADRLPTVDEGEAAARTQEDGFDLVGLGPQWATLRRPAADDWLSLTERPSHLRIRGGRSPQSLIGPSLVARRVTAPRCAFETTMDFRPHAFQQLAGVTAYYNTRNWHFAYVTEADDGTPVLRLTTSDHGDITVHPAEVPVGGGRLRLGLDVDGGELRFRYDAGTGWQALGSTLDATILSDEHAVESADGQVRALGFTGAFVGLWVWDLTGHGHHADFDDATYTAFG
jgi:xylan 1,4-beta-xylosidase